MRACCWTSPMELGGRTMTCLETGNSNVLQTKIKALESSLFEPGDSDDEFDFSFLPTRYAEGSKKPDRDNESEKKNYVDSTIFTIDRGISDGQPGIESVGGSSSKEAPPHGSSESFKERRSKVIAKARKVVSSLQTGEIDGYNINPKQSEKSSKNKEPEIMNKSVITDGYEKKHAVPAYSEGKKALVKKRREERAKTKGKDWYDMKAPEMTDDLKADIEALQMRGNAASWTGYRKNDYKSAPKYFQVATVQDSAIDFYHSRVPKKDRKRTLVDELLADAEFRKTNKKMYMQAVEKLEPQKRRPKAKRTK